MASPQLKLEIARFMERTPRSKRLQEEASHYLPGGSSRGGALDPYSTWIERGEGRYVYDVDGNRYLDFMNNATSLIMGHAHPLIVAALQEQAAKGTSFSGPSEPQIRFYTYGHNRARVATLPLGKECWASSFFLHCGDSLAKL